MDSNSRVALVQAQLMQGHLIDADDIIARYHISVRTFQRDLAHVANALRETGAAAHLVEGPSRHWRLVWGDSALQLGVVLAIANVMLGSRALDAGEQRQVLAVLQAQLPPTQQEALAAQLQQVRHGYVPLSGAKPLLALIQKVALAIQDNHALTFRYHGVAADNTAELQVHHAQPVAVFFENHYFYVAMYSQEHHGYWLYRLDRIETILASAKGEKLDYATRFSLQDHRRQTYLLDMGAVVTCRFRYTGRPSNALDYFPTSKVVRENADGSVVIEAYVKDEGALLWLIGQGPRVKVVSPPLMVKRIKALLEETRAQYGD